MTLGDPLIRVLTGIRPKIKTKKTNPTNKFEKALGEISDFVIEVKAKYDLSDLEIRDVLELVSSDYI